VRHATRRFQLPGISFWGYGGKEILDMMLGMLINLWLLDDWMLKKFSFLPFGLHELPPWKLRCFRRTKAYAS